MTSLDSVAGSGPKFGARTLVSLLAKHAPVWCACGGAPVLLELLAVEWAHPLCNHAQGEAILAVHGFPLPYAQWAGSSMEYMVLPHVLLLNLVLLAVTQYLVLVPLLRRWEQQSPAVIVRLVAGGLGAVMLLLSALWYSLLFGAEVLHPTLSLGGPEIGSFASYWELRPVRFPSHWDYLCDPSEAWFGKVIP